MKTSQLILQSQHPPDCKARPGHDKRKKRKWHLSWFYKHSHANLQQVGAKRSPRPIKRTARHTQVGFIQEPRGGFTLITNQYN